MVSGGAASEGCKGSMSMKTQKKTQEITGHRMWRDDKNWVKERTANKMGSNGSIHEMLHVS